MIAAKPPLSEIKDSQHGFGATDEGVSRSVVDCSGQPWWEAYELIKQFATTFKLESMGLNILRTDNEKKVAQMGELLLCAEVSCIIRDIATTFAMLDVTFKDMHTTKLRPDSVARATLSSKVVPLVRNLLDKLTDLDKRVESKIAKVVELSATRQFLPTSMALIRPWRQLAAKLASRFLKQAVLEFVRHLEAITANLRNTVPVWRSAFTNGEFAKDIANEALLGREGSVIQAHNDLHAYLVEFKKCTCRLELVPPISKHPASMSHVAIASTLLSDAKTAAAVCQATGIVIKMHDTIEGAKEAEKFIARSTNKFPSFPDILWNELKELAKYATVQVAGTSTNPSGLAEKKGPTMTAKTEPLDKQPPQANAAIGVEELACVGSASSSSVASSVPQAAPRRGLKRSRVQNA